MLEKIQPILIQEGSSNFRRISKMSKCTLNDCAWRRFFCKFSWLAHRLGRILERMSIHQLKTIWKLNENERLASAAKVDVLRYSIQLTNNWFGCSMENLTPVNARLSDFFFERRWAGKLWALNRQNFRFKIRVKD